MCNREIGIKDVLRMQSRKDSCVHFCSGIEAVPHALLMLTLLS